MKNGYILHSDRALVYTINNSKLADIHTMEEFQKICSPVVISGIEKCFEWFKYEGTYTPGLLSVEVAYNTVIAEKSTFIIEEASYSEDYERNLDILMILKPDIIKYNIRVLDFIVHNNKCRVYKLRTYDSSLGAEDEIKHSGFISYELDKLSLQDGIYKFNTIYGLIVTPKSNKQ